MPNLQLPLSGNVDQIINPWNWLFSTIGSQIGLINVNLGKSTNPALEQRILADVGTYGRQLGRISEALEVLLRHVKLDDLDADERKKITAFLYMQDEIASLKASAGERPPKI